MWFVRLNYEHIAEGFLALAWDCGTGDIDCGLIENAKRYETKEDAETDAFKLVTLRPGFLGKVRVEKIG